MSGKGVVVLGAGGHCKVCIELLQAGGQHVAYCVAAPGSSGTTLGVPVLGGDDHLARLRAEGFDEIFVAIGANRLREKLGALAAGLGFRLVNAISPRATISPSSRLGQGIAVMAGAVINADTIVEDLAIINTMAGIDHDGRIGRAAHVGPHCGLAGNVEIGARAFLGVGCSVIPEIKVGADAVAGAGSVIIRNVSANSKIAGIPARTIDPKETSP